MLKISLFVVLFMAFFSHVIAETPQETAAWESLEETLDKAETGDPIAIAELGRHYFFGDQIAQSYDDAFTLWDHAVGLGGQKIECHILRMANDKNVVKTADGMFLKAYIMLLGGCYFDGSEAPIAFSLLHRAGQLYIDQGQPGTANMMLSTLSLYDSPIARKYSRSLQKSLSEQ